jgi:hypothetical protein
MPKYKVLKKFTGKDGRAYAPDQEIELDEAQAQEHLKRGEVAAAETKED